MGSGCFRPASSRGLCAACPASALTQPAHADPWSCSLSPGDGAGRAREGFAVGLRVPLLRRQLCLSPACRVRKPFACTSRVLCCATTSTRLCAAGAPCHCSARGFGQALDADCRRPHRCRFIPDKLMKRHSVPRTASVVFLGALSAASALLSAVSDMQLLNASAFLSGFAFGGMQVPSSICPVPLCKAAQPPAQPSAAVLHAGSCRRPLRTASCVHRLRA